VAEILTERGRGSVKPDRAVGADAMSTGRALQRIVSAAQLNAIIYHHQCAFVFRQNPLMSSLAATAAAAALLPDN